MAYESKLVMPAHYAAIGQDEAVNVEGGSFLLTALGVYGAYSIYTNFCNYVKNNAQVVQQFQKSLASGFSSFLSVFERFAVLKFAFDLLKFIF